MSGSSAPTSLPVYVKPGWRKTHLRPPQNFEHVSTVPILIGQRRAGFSAASLHQRKARADSLYKGALGLLSPFRVEIMITFSGIDFRQHQKWPDQQQTKKIKDATFPTERTLCFQAFLLDVTHVAGTKHGKTVTSEPPPSTSMSSKDCKEKVSGA